MLLYTSIHPSIHSTPSILPYQGDTSSVLYASPPSAVLSPSASPITPPPPPSLPLPLLLLPPPLPALLAWSWEWILVLMSSSPADAEPPAYSDEREWLDDDSVSIHLCIHPSMHASLQSLPPPTYLCSESSPPEPSTPSGAASG